MKIDELLFSEGSADFYDPSFRFTLESHVAYLRASRQTYVINVQPHDTVVYNQDLFGFLNQAKVPAYLHWLVMRMNNFFSPYDFNSECVSLKIPSSKEVEVFRQSWKTTPVLTT